MHSSHELFKESFSQEDKITTFEIIEKKEKKWVKMFKLQAESEIYI